MSTETILIVDDDLQTLEFLAKHFLPRLGYKTLTASNGQTALEIVREHRPDLMLLDLQMPDITGLDVLRQLHDEGHSVPTIFLTAYGSERIVVEALRLGVKDYLTKPVDLDILKESITRILEAAQLRREKEKLAVRLERQVTRLTVLAKIGQSVISTLELDQVLRQIVEASVYLTQAEEGFLALLDEQSGQLYLRAAKNIDQDESQTLRLKITDSLLGNVIRTGQAFRMTQSDQDSPLKLSTGFLVKSLVHVPIISKGKTLGVLSVDNRLKKRFFSKTDETLLISLAGYAAVAIENARLYDEATNRAAEATSFARELKIVNRQESQLRESLNRLRFTFLNAIGHELETPLTIMLHTLETMSDPQRVTLDPQQEEMVETLRQQSLRLRRMIGSLVTFAGFTAKQDDLKFHPTPLNAVLDDALQLTLFKTQRKDIQLKDQRPDDLPTLVVDGERLSEAVVNLLDNAIRVSPSDAPVILSVQVYEDKVEISVQDFGPGIPEKEQAHIWDGFIQINRSLQRGLEGLGLGLAMARYIVEAHCGTLSLHSAPGQGSTFTITLPRQQKMTGVLPPLSE